MALYLACLKGNKTVLKKIYYIECSPILSETNKESFWELGKGFPMSGEQLEERRLVWTLTALTGCSDRRTKIVYERNRKIEVWLDRKMAVSVAKKEDLRLKGYWSHKVKEAQINNVKGKQK